MTPRRVWSITLGSITRCSTMGRSRLVDSASKCRGPAIFQRRSRQSLVHPRPSGPRRGDEGIPIVLDLVDQVHGVRHALRDVLSAIQARTGGRHASRMIPIGTPCRRDIRRPSHGSDRDQLRGLSVPARSESGRADAFIIAFALIPARFFSSSDTGRRPSSIFSPSSP